MTGQYSIQNVIWRTIAEMYCDVLRLNTTLVNYLCDVCLSDNYYDSCNYKLFIQLSLDTLVLNLLFGELSQIDRNVLHCN